MVDVDLTIRTVEGIYTYSKDHTTESTIFTLWIKKVTPFPSLRWKIQAFKNDKRQNTMTPWSNSSSVQFSIPPKLSRNPRKHATDKIRTRWSSRNYRFNPIKTNRFNTMGTEASNKINMVKTTLRMACDGFGPSCSYCK